MSTKVFPMSSIFTSYTNSKYQHRSFNSRFRSGNSTDTNSATKLTSELDAPVVLTVWKKSLLMNCNGFTVFDGKGNLVFRVDNYVAGNRGEIVLMDATGKPLLTIRRKRLSLGDCWMIYDGEKTTANPKLCVKKNVNLLTSKTLLAQVTAAASTTTVGSSSPLSSPKKNAAVYDIEGSYTQRSVSIYDSSRHCVAEIRRKEAAGGISLGVDVFSLAVSKSHIDNATAMGFVILLEQMFGSNSSSNGRRYYSH